MKFCSECGGPVVQRVPPGDHLLRHVCHTCGTTHYQNPRIVTGCVPEWQGRILLCRRAIEPRKGFWTIPAGFLENGETTMAGAARESMEEGLASVEIGSLLAIVHLVHINEVHVTFRARLLDGSFGVGAESLDSMLVAERDVPWAQLAYPSVEFVLRRYFMHRAARREESCVAEINAAGDVLAWPASAAHHKIAAAQCAYLA